MTTAFTPNAENHGRLNKLDSRFVEIPELPWEETNFDGVNVKTLLLDKSSGLLTALIRMEPGAILPDHEHMLIEQTFVIEGHLVCGEGECKAGNFVWRPASSRHTAWSPNGGIMLGIFQVPNKFFRNEKESDMLDQDWFSMWGRSSNLQTQK